MRPTCRSLVNHCETLAGDELAALARAYESLATRSASSQTRFGPVAAAKTLFLLRPHACPPWDNAIREYLECDISRDGYQKYLGEILRLIIVLAAEARVPAHELPQQVGREGSSPAEVVDEYLWVRCARGERWNPPSQQVLGCWAAWARDKGTG